LPLAIASLVLLVLGWWMVLNGRALYDGEFAMFVHLSNVATALPGSLDQAVSVAAMWRATVLLGTVCIVADACVDSRWLMRLCDVAAGTGGSIALLGLVQKATHAPMIFWREVDQPVTTFFGTYFYHGSAGAFLNLTLPLTIGLAVRAFQRREPVARALWLALAVVSVIAVFTNTSRMGHVVALAILFVLAAVTLMKARTRRTRVRWHAVAAGGVALLLAAYAMTRSVDVERSLGRWEQAAEVIPLDARWTVTRIAFNALPESGWFGFGAGTFHVVFPYLTGGSSDARLSGFWRYLHQDYLQALLEWGWIGAALWGWIFFGGIAVGVMRLRSTGAETWKPRRRLLLPLIVLALAGVAAHAAVDFPLQIASIQLYAAVFVGICWSSRAWRAE
jgi:O-antigen ligase